MASKRNTPKPKPAPERVEVAPELLASIKAAAADYKRNVSGALVRLKDAEAKRTPEVARLTFEAMEAGMWSPERKRPEGVESQADYAERFGVQSGSVTRWKRIGRVMSLGLDPESAHFKALVRVVNDKPVADAIESGKGLPAISKAIESRVDKTALKRGEVKVLPRPKKTKHEGDDKGPEVNLSAASVVEFFGLASATVVGQWDKWSLKPQTASALLDTLDGLREFVAEQQTSSKTARPRSKRTA